MNTYQRLLQDTVSFNHTINFTRKIFKSKEKVILDCLPILYRKPRQLDPPIEVLVEPVKPVEPVDPVKPVKPVKSQSNLQAPGVQWQLIVLPEGKSSIDQKGLWESEKSPHFVTRPGQKRRRTIRHWCLSLGQLASRRARVVSNDPGATVKLFLIEWSVPQARVTSFHPVLIPPLLSTLRSFQESVQLCNPGGWPIASWSLRHESHPSTFFLRIQYQHCHYCHHQPK